MPEDPPRRSLLDVRVDAGPITTLALSGELDPATAPVLDDAITAAAVDGVTQVVLDLAGITFLDSSGLRVLVAARERLRAAGADLALRSPSPNIRRVIEITGLGEVITLD